MFSKLRLPKLLKDFSGVILCTLLYISVFYRKKYAIYPGNYDLTGAPVILYNISGLIFFLLTILVIYTAGAAILRLSSYRSDYNSSYYIYSMILGFVGLNALFSIFGHFSLLKLEYLLPVSTLLLIYFPKLYRYAPLFRQCQPSYIRNSLIIFNILVFCYLLIMRGVAIGEGSGDVYEHYLHYYDDVISSGQSLVSRDIWLHNYDLRGLGLFFYAGILGDVLQIQYISLIAFLIIVLITADFLYRATSNVIPSCCGTLILIALWLDPGYEAGSLLKHHTLIHFQIVALIYLLTKTFNSNDYPKQDAYIIYFTCFSACFVTIQLSGIIFAGLFPISIIFLYYKEYKKLWILYKAMCCGIAGVLASILLNFYLTGLGGVVPGNLFFKFYNPEIFDSIWNKLNFEYWFGEEQDGLKISFFSAISLQRVSIYLRLLYLRDFYLNFIGVAVIGVFFIVANSRFKKIPEAIILVITFLIGCILLALFFSQDSIGRIFSFTIILEIISIIYFSWIGFGAIFKKERMIKNLFFSATAVCTTILVLYANSTQNPNRTATVLKYFFGGVPVSETIRLFANTGTARSMFDHLVDFRKKIDILQGKVLTLSYDPNIAYFFPEKIISEPSYSFGRIYPKLIYSDSLISKEIFQENNIQYFLINLDREPFLAIPFSRLFDPNQLATHFKIVYKSDRVYVLSWLEDGSITNIDTAFILEYTKFLDGGKYKYKFSTFNTNYKN